MMPTSGGAIGSSYKRHYARSEWEMRRESGDGFTIGLYHHKANNAPRKSGAIRPEHRD